MCVCLCFPPNTGGEAAQIWESVKCYNLIRTVSPFTVRHDQQIVKGYTQPHTHTLTRARVKQDAAQNSRDRDRLFMVGIIGIYRRLAVAVAALEREGG